MRLCLDPENQKRRRKGERRCKEPTKVERVDGVRDPRSYPSEYAIMLFVASRTSTLFPRDMQLSFFSSSRSTRRRCRLCFHAIFNTNQNYMRTTCPLVPFCHALIQSPGSHTPVYTRTTCFHAFRCQHDVPPTGITTPYPKDIHRILAASFQQHSCFNYSNSLHRAEIGPSQPPVGNPVRRDRYFATTTATHPSIMVSSFCAPIDCRFTQHIISCVSLVVSPPACDNRTNPTTVHYTQHFIIIIRPTRVNSRRIYLCMTFITSVYVRLAV